jgi:transcription-repair coupling factor (superfamily II helicase)
VISGALSKACSGSELTVTWEEDRGRQLAKGIHALWMSTTPIPRALAAGLAGFRDSASTRCWRECNQWPRISVSSVVDEIDDRMMSFVEGAADVLLATNIVESGLDIPRANTIVVCWPERFGLAQLHQLRGRVGRGAIRAFAYLLTDSGAERSEKRLAALEEFNRPGAGFAISAGSGPQRSGGTCFRNGSRDMCRCSDRCSTATF